MKSKVQRLIATAGAAYRRLVVTLFRRAPIDVEVVTCETCRGECRLEVQLRAVSGAQAAPAFEDIDCGDCAGTGASSFDLRRRGQLLGYLSPRDGFTAQDAERVAARYRHLRDFDAERAIEREVR